MTANTLKKFLIVPLKAVIRPTLVASKIVYLGGPPQEVAPGFFEHFFEEQSEKF
jgi:hypothetical protein